MTQADAKHGDFRLEVSDDVEANPRLSGRFRAGGEQNSLRFEGCNVVEREGVVADNFRFHTEFADVSGEGVDETVVVVDEQQQGILRCRAPLPYPLR